ATSPASSVSELITARFLNCEAGPPSKRLTRQSNDLVHVRMALYGIQHEGGNGTERYRAAAGRKRAWEAAIHFIGCVEKAWRPRDGPIHGCGAHDFFGPTKVPHHILQHPAQECEARSLFGKQHGGGYQYKPLYTSPRHSDDCTGSAVLDQGVWAKRLPRGNAQG